MNRLVNFLTVHAVDRPFVFFRDIGLLFFFFLIMVVMYLSSTCV